MATEKRNVRALSFVWITAAFMPRDRNPFPGVGLWADDSPELMKDRIRTLNAPDSWLRHAGYTCKMVGRFDRRRRT